MPTEPSAQMFQDRLKSVKSTHPVNPTARRNRGRTAKHIGGSFAMNGNSCNVEQRDDYSDSENERVNASLMHEIDLANKTIILTPLKGLLS